MVAAVSVIFVLVICLASLTRLSFENDISKSFSSDSSYSREYSTLISSLGFVPKQIVILAESAAPLKLTDYEVLRDLSFELELTDNVSSVFSVASVRFPKNHSNYPNASLLPADLGAALIEPRLAALEKAGLRAPVSANRKSALFVVSLIGGLSDDLFFEARQELRDAVRQYGGSRLQFQFTGEELIGPEMVQALKHDLIVNNVLGCLLAFLLALFLFGNIRLVLIAFLPALVAALFAMATFTFLNISITVLNTVIPILILVLALADSIHLTLHFRDDNRELPPIERVETAVSTVGPACALTAITTAIAFAAIGTSGNQQLEELALVGAVSVLASYIAVIVSFALLARLLGSSVQPTRMSEWLVVPDHWSDHILNNIRRIGAVCAVVVCISLVGLANVFPWFNLDENLPTDSAVRITNQKIAAEFGGIYRIWSEIDVTGENSLDTEHGWKRLISLTHAIESAAPDYPVVSLATLSRWQGQPEAILSPEQLQSVPEEFMVQLLSKDGRVARVITVAPEAMLDLKSYEIQSKIEKTAKQSGAVRSVGLPVIMLHESVSVILQLCVGLGIAVLISVVLVAAFYSWPMLAAALIIPNALPLAVAASSLILIQSGELTPTAMLALTVAFGIAIDDSIHFVNRYISETKSGRDAEQALKISIQKTGKAMLFTTILICSGTLVTMFSSFETIRLFGGILILTFVTAFLADILLLPCLLRAMSTRT